MQDTKNIDKGVSLYTHNTPNCWKVAIFLEEVGWPYDVKPINIFKGEQKQPDFVKDICPNGRIPVIVDHDNGDLAVCESGAILMYLAERAGKFYPSAPQKRVDCNIWLAFQVAGIGPMMGQAFHFLHAAPKIEYAQTRYLDEVARLLSVLEVQLSKHEWVAADEYTIVDIAIYPWLVVWPMLALDMEPYPSVLKWMERCHTRVAVRKGITVPEGNDCVTALKDYEKQKQIAAGVKAKLTPK